MGYRVLGRGWRRNVVASCVVFGMVSMLSIPLNALAQQQSLQAPLENLLEQLQQLQEQGTLGDVGAAGME